jgi:hypothetical protein
MSTKRIYHWQAGNTQLARGFIFGDYGRSAAKFDALVKEAQKDFPSLTREDIELSIITKSSYMKGFILAEFALPAGTEREGYDPWKGATDFERA